MLTLNGEVIPGHNMQLRSSFRLADAELSGQSASTVRAEQGIKAQTLNITVEIKHDEADELARLIALARSIEENGTRTIYRIVHPLATACKIRAVVFTDNFTVNDSANLQQWRVSFVLAERESRPEALENRQVKVDTTTLVDSTSFDAVYANIDRQAIV